MGKNNTVKNFYSDIYNQFRQNPETFWWIFPALPAIGFLILRILFNRAGFFKAFLAMIFYGGPITSTPLALILIIYALIWRKILKNKEKNNQEAGEFLGKKKQLIALFLRIGTMYLALAGAVLSFLMYAEAFIG